MQEADRVTLDAVEEGDSEEVTFKQKLNEMRSEA